jgi:hypothetical protein
MYINKAESATKQESAKRFIGPNSAQIAKKSVLSAQPRRITKGKPMLIFGFLLLNSHAIEKPITKFR